MDIRSNVYERRSLGDVCTLQRGFDLPTKNRNPGEYALVTSSGPTDTHDEARVTGPGVVTGRSGSIGNVFFIEGDFWPLNTTLYVKDFHGNDERYVFYLLQYFDLGKFASGAGVPTLNRNHVHSESVQVACNLDEQKRIVAVLDQAFAALDRARALAEANLADAQELGRSVVTQEIKAAHLNGATETTLGALCAIARGGSPRPIARFLTDDEDGVNWIKISDATSSGQYIEHTQQKITRDGISRSRYVEPGSFLLTNSMSFGRPYILRTSGCIHDGWLVLEPDYKRVDQDYLYYLLGSAEIYDQFDSAAAGSTVRNLNIRLVSEVVVALPALHEQRVIVARIGKRLTQADSLRRAYERKLADLANLRQSLLHQAFSGELTLG